MRLGQGSTESRLRLLLSALIVVFAGAGPAQALTMEDVIALTRSGYDEKAILRLIEDTGSVFHLTAEDLVALKNAGVSERVMVAMIQSARGGMRPATTEARPEERVPETREQEEEHEQPLHGASAAHPESAGAPHVDSPRTKSPSPLPARPLIWFAYSFQEDAHAGGHDHAAVAYGDIDVLILRSEAGFPSVRDRADGVAARIASLFLDPLATLEVRKRKEDGAHGLYKVSSGVQEEKLLQVTRSDAAACAKRSARAVDVELLSRWWAALVRDYHRILARGEPPRETSALHPGEALMAPYELARQRAPEGPLSAEALTQALGSLSRTQREHLSEMAGSVPRDFEPQHSH